MAAVWFDECKDNVKAEATAVTSTSGRFLNMLNEPCHLEMAFIKKICFCEISESTYVDFYQPTCVA